MRNATLRLAVVRRREFRVLFVASLGLHVGLIAAWALAPSPGIRIPPGIVAVELVAMPAPRAVPVPEAAPVPAPPEALPAPPPPPKPPVPKKVVLPKDPTPEASKPRVEPKPKPKPQPRKRAPEPPPVIEEPVEQEYTDVMAQLRSELGEKAPAPESEPAPAVAPAPPGGAVGVQVSPEVAAWMRAAKVHVRRAWVVPPGFRTEALETQVMVRLDAGGNVVGEPRIVRRSGNPWYDEGVVRAIQKASPLPAPPQPDEWGFVFVPEDSY